MSRRTHRDHTLAVITRGVLWAGGVVAALFAVRAMPDLRRYLRIRRM